MELLTLVTLAASFVSVAAAVINVYFARKGGPNELQADVEELALLVERMGKASRREKMARVRAARIDGGSLAEPIPGLLDASGDGSDGSNTPTDLKAHKAALRRRMRNMQ